MMISPIAGSHNCRDALLDHDCVSNRSETPISRNDKGVPPRNASVLVDRCPYVSITGYIYIEEMSVHHSLLPVYIYIYIYIYVC